MRSAAVPCVGEGMVAHRVIVRSCDVVFFKGVIEANDGLAAVFGEHGGDLLVTAPLARSEELESVLTALCAELGAMRLPP